VTIKIKWYIRGKGVFYQVLIFLLLCTSQGSVFTVMCYASPPYEFIYVRIITYSGIYVDKA
jgi:hypothetical protein